MNVNEVSPSLVICLKIARRKLIQSDVMNMIILYTRGREMYYFCTNLVSAQWFKPIRVFHDKEI